MHGCGLGECGHCVCGVSYLPFSGGSEMVAWDDVRAKIRNTTELLAKHSYPSVP
jgi:hypothetical protein